MRDDISADEALRVLNTDYWDDVRGVVAEAKRAIRDNEATDEETFWQLFDKHTDGHQRVIYTHQAHLGLCFTNNVEAYIEELGEPPPTVKVQMLYSLRADAMAMLGSYDQLCEELEEERQS